MGTYFGGHGRHRQEPRGPAVTPRRPNARALAVTACTCFIRLHEPWWVSQATLETAHPKQGRYHAIDAGVLVEALEPLVRTLPDDFVILVRFKDGTSRQISIAKPKGWKPGQMWSNPFTSLMRRVRKDPDFSFLITFAPRAEA